MKVLFVGTYLPRRCGIATFTSDLAKSLSGEVVDFQIVAMNNIPEGYLYPQEVVFEIPQNQLEKYEQAADFINFSDVDVVCLQHEFGIFGGPEGAFVCNLMGKVTKPIVTTLHTILRRDDIKLGRYIRRLEKVVNLSTIVVTISEKGKEILVDDYKVPENKVVVIPHGVPDVPFIDPNYYKGDFDALDKFILLTFGLISPGKGIETVIQTLPQVVKNHPNVVYFVVGATHPEVKRLHGEAYRISLEQMVKKLNIENNVRFFNQFVSDEQLKRFIGASDVFITPYPNKHQISSGTLARAVGSGKAVVSTPYWHAEELLADGRGLLVDFNSVDSMKEAILTAIEKTVEFNQMRKYAYDYGRRMIWSNVAGDYKKVFEKAISERLPIKEFVSITPTLPEATKAIMYLSLLTDSTSVIRCATCGLPNRQEGYRTDDAALALIATLRYYDLYNEPVLDLIHTYLTHIRHAQTEKGLFRDSYSYSREWQDEQGTSDTQGRVIWALCTLIARSPSKYSKMKLIVNRMLDKSTPFVDKCHNIRPCATTINGLWEILCVYPGASYYQRKIRELSNQLVSKYNDNRTPDWRWYEPILSYENAKIPEALLLAYQHTGDRNYLRVGKESLDFLISLLYQPKQKYFDLIGSKGWYSKNNKRALFVQKPIDASYLVMACLTAYNVTKDSHYIGYAEEAFEWFLGRNRANTPLYDFELGCCYDGLEENGVISNDNGAESTISFLLALLKLRKHYLLIHSGKADQLPISDFV